MLQVAGDRARVAELTAAELAVAKRQAIALLGQRVRESDLPSDSDVRSQLLAISEVPRFGSGEAAAGEVKRLADHVDRFAIYRMRLLPLQEVRLNARLHPEGDALYHSLQVFEQARAVRPYDEEFQLAALLHHVGQAIDASDPIGAGLRALEGTLTERATWLIAHLPELMPAPGQTSAQKAPPELRSSEHLEDLEVLAALDVEARVAGARVCSVDEALEFIRALEESNLGAGDEA